MSTFIHQKHEATNKQIKQKKGKKESNQFYKQNNEFNLVQTEGQGFVYPQNCLSKEFIDYNNNFQSTSFKSNLLNETTKRTTGNKNTQRKHSGYRPNEQKKEVSKQYVKKVTQSSQSGTDQDVSLDEKPQIQKKAVNQNDISFNEDNSSNFEKDSSENEDAKQYFYKAESKQDKAIDEKVESNQGNVFKQIKLISDSKIEKIASPKIQSEEETTGQSQSSIINEQNLQNIIIEQKQQQTQKLNTLLKFLSGLSSKGGVEESSVNNKTQLQSSHYQAQALQQQSKFYEKSRALIAPKIASLPIPF